ncbi:MAG TPA: hypothetical protein EYQ54_04290 [Myxococcales bacterium]|nr:hypothetical protein [Myxococcales bacterium]
MLELYHNAASTCSQKVRMILARPAFAVAVTEWLPEPILALFRAGGEAVWPEVEPLTRSGD